MKFCLYIYLLTVLISGLIGAVRFKNLTVPIKILSILVWIIFLCESVAEYLSHKINNNTQVYHFYVILAFWLYVMIYFQILRSVRLKFAVIIAAILFTFFSVINSLFYQKLDSFPSINLTISDVILVFLSLFYLKISIDHNPFEPLRKNSLFWFNISVLVYFSLQLFIWGIMNYLITNDKDVTPLIMFGLIISILFYTALGISIILDNPKTSVGDHG